MARDESNQRLKLFPIWLLIGLGLIATVVFLSLTAKPLGLVEFKANDKVGHLVAYSVLMTWFGQLYARRVQLFYLAMGFIAMGVSLEYAQSLGNHRHFEYADMVANSVGVLLGLLLSAYIFKGMLQRLEARWLLKS